MKGPKDNVVPFILKRSRGGGESDELDPVGILDLDRKAKELGRIMDTTCDRPFVYHLCGQVDDMNPESGPVQTWAVLKTGAACSGRTLNQFVKWCCRQSLNALLMGGRLRVLIAIPNSVWKRTSSHWVSAVSETFHTHLHPRFASRIGSDLSVLVASSPEEAGQKLNRLPNLMPIIFTNSPMEELEEILPFDLWVDLVENWPF